MSATLSAADLLFINEVAARRFAGGPQDGVVDQEELAGALAEATEGTPFVRASALAAAVLRRQLFSSAPLQTALLILHCALAREGFNLLAPQGVVAGMIRDLAVGGDTTAVARWVEDRAVPAASG